MDTFRGKGFRKCIRPFNEGGQEPIALVSVDFAPLKTMDSQKTFHFGLFALKSVDFASQKGDFAHNTIPPPEVFFVVVVVFVKIEAILSSAASPHQGQTVIINT